MDSLDALLSRLFTLHRKAIELSLGRIERLLAALRPAFDSIGAQLVAVSELRERPAGTIRITTGDQLLPGSPEVDEDGIFRKQAYALSRDAEPLSNVAVSAIGCDEIVGANRV